MTFRSLFSVSFRSIVLRVLPVIAGLFATPSAEAALSATFNAETDVPVTAASYTPVGEVDFTLNFAPEPGTNLTVVKNTGLPFIDGTFSNLANGATVNLSHNGKTYPFVAWYYGGEGNNDLVLLWPYTLIAGWGNNLYGQLGDGTNVKSTVPSRVDQTGVLAGKTIVQVVQGNLFTLALTTEGRVYSWGFNYYGALGNGSTTASNLPVAVSAESDTSALYGKEVVYLTAGMNHSLAICSDGTVVGWGRNESGQLGDGTTQNRPLPVVMDTSSENSALYGKSAVSVSAGQAHSLVLCSDGTMVSCGSNVAGQLGDGTLIQRLSPVLTGTDALAMNGKTVRFIASGSDHNLALCSDGTVMSWGSNSSGALGDNTISQRSIVAPVNSASGISALFGKSVAAISAGSMHSLALCTDGTLTGWGNNSGWQLGDSLPGRSLPIIINKGALTNKGVVSIAAAGLSSLALLADSSLVFWGTNNGDGNSQPRVVEQIVGVSPFGSVRVSRLADKCHSGSHVLSIYRVPFKEIAVRGNGRAIASGDVNPNFAHHTDFGAVPLNTGARVRTFTITSTGMASLSLTGAPKVTISGSHATDFVVTSAPGSPLDPLSGTTTFQITFSPTAEGIRRATVSILSDDEDEPSYTFDIKGLGSLGGFSFDNAADAALTVSSYTATGEASLSLNFAPQPGTSLTVVENTGPAFIEGNFSNLANGSTVNLSHNGKTYPFIVWYYGGEGNNDLVLLWPKTVLAVWGSNYAGQLAVSNYGEPNHYWPELANTYGTLEEKTIVQVAQGGAHTLALTTEGKVYAWGGNAAGQLGDNSLVSKAVPVEVNVASGISSLAGKTVVAIAAGNAHSLALCSDGTLSAWGYNVDSALGIGAPNNRSVPVAVNTVSGTSALHGKVVTAMAAGMSHSLALCSDGTLVAWGSNLYGQLGDGSSTTRNVPVTVSTAEGVSALHGKTVKSMVAGSSHSLALCSDGSLAAWGSNENGRLGNGEEELDYGYYTTRPLPVAVVMTGALAGRQVTTISSGRSHNLALCSDGTVTAWGDNARGQLGTNLWQSEYAPALVNTAEGLSALAGKTVVGIACGFQHSLALCSDNTLVSWGSDEYGQLGGGFSTGNGRNPQKVSMGDLGIMVASRKVTGLPNRSGGMSNSSMVMLEGALRDISVTGNGLEIVSGDTTPETGDFTDFGEVSQTGEAVKRTFWIVNRGAGILHFPGSTFVEVYSSHFYVSRQPLQTYTDRNGRVSFDISCAPRALGLQTAIVTIRSDDPDEGIYTFNIQCFGRGSEIEVRDGGVNMISNNTTASFGNVGSGGVVQKTFVINNLGNADLTGLTLAKTGLNPGEYSIFVPPTVPVPPGGSTSFVVQASPAIEGVRTASLRISSNDRDESTFSIPMTVTGVSATLPGTAKPSVENITFDGATLTAEVNAKGSERSVFFEYGTTYSYGSRVAATPATVAGNAPTAVSAMITGLLPNTKYYYRVRAEGVQGSGNGEEKTFTTLNRPPSAVADSAVAMPGGQVVIPVLSNDTDPGDVLNIASFTQPAATVGKVTKVGNTLVFTAAAGFKGGTFSYAAGDAFRGKSASAPVTLTLGTCSIGPDVTIPADSPPYELAVAANAPFGVIENVSWLSFVPPGPGATSVTFIPTPNAAKTSRTATVNVGGQTHTVTQLGVSELPVLTVPEPIPNAAISASYELAIPTQNGPVTYTATGLQKGLTLSNATGKITGYPTEAKTSTVTVKAKNAQGESNTITFDITVLDIPASVVGSFSATIESDTTLTDKLGGFMTMTVTKTGAVSGTLKLGAGSHPFTGKLSTAENPAEPDPEHAVLRTSVKRTGKPNVELLVRMNDGGTNFISGELTLAGPESASLDLEGSRHVWDAKTNPADNYKAYYTVALPTSNAAGIPQGDGFLTFTVMPAGAVSWSGQLPDGTAITAQTSALWADGRVPLFAVFGKGLGSLTQRLSISAGTRLVTGPLRWHKKPQVMRAYADGFESTTLHANGSEYLPPGAGRTLLNRTAPASFVVEFMDGGIEGVSNFSHLDQVLQLTAKHVLSISSQNPMQVKITKLDLTKGTFTGTLSLQDANPFNAAMPQVLRPVTFQGVLLPSLFMGSGYFLLPGIAGPPVNVKTSAMTSGQVRIRSL